MIHNIPDIYIFFQQNACIKMIENIQNFYKVLMSTLNVFQNSLTLINYFDEFPNIIYRESNLTKEQRKESMEITFQQIELLKINRIIKISLIGNYFPIIR